MGETPAAGTAAGNSKIEPAVQEPTGESKKGAEGTVPEYRQNPLL